MHPRNMDASLRKDEPACRSANGCSGHRVAQDKPQTASQICACTASSQTDPGLPMAQCPWICLPPGHASLLGRELRKLRDTFKGPVDIHACVSE